MAIVINGSGTVTGISVGGLPDDIVDAGTLADNAVGLAQMAGGTDGNIITYDTSGNPAVVATGSDGQVLTSAGADAVPAFEAAAGGGKILQVVTDQASDEESTTAVSFVTYDAVSVTITPATTSSRILLLMTVGRIMVNSRIYVDFQRAISGGTTTTGISGEGNGMGYWEGDGTDVRQFGTFTTVDSPSTTSAITYKMCYHTNDFQEAFIGEDHTETSITAIEIGA